MAVHPETMMAAAKIGTAMLCPRPTIMVDKVRYKLSHINCKIL
jgi:hypothetical protein